MSDTNEQILSEVLSMKGEVSAMHGSVKSLDSNVAQLQKAIYGNGKPGLETRIDRVEQKDETRTKHAKTLLKGFATVAALCVSWLAFFK